MGKIDFNSLNVSKSSDGLIPTVIQDDVTLRVLMVGYMDREALEKTVSTGRVTFFSRTKQRLWTKGETSGNYLDVVSIASDCDSDTLLIRVRPHGPACHNGTVSCFTDTFHTVGESRPAGDADAEGFIRRLGDVIRRRHAEMPEGSYTTTLFTKGVNKISQKVGEEAVETVIEAVAGNRDAFLYEASDLVYHLLVLLEQMNCSITDIEHELKSRHK